MDHTHVADGIRHGRTRSVAVRSRLRNRVTIVDESDALTGDHRPRVRIRRRRALGHQAVRNQQHARGNHAQHRRKERLHDSTSWRGTTPRSMPCENLVKTSSGDLAGGHRGVNGPALKTHWRFRVCDDVAGVVTSKACGRVAYRPDALYIRAAPTTSAVE